MLGSCHVARSASRSSTWASTISHLMVSSRILSSHYLEINPQTLTQVFSLALMDHEDLLMGSNPSKKSLSSLEATMGSVDLQPWWQGTQQQPKLSCHAQSRCILRVSLLIKESLVTLVNPSQTISILCLITCLSHTRDVLHMHEGLNPRSRHES